HGDRFQPTEGTGRFGQLLFSTIGPITASHLGVRTVDIGLPTFAMHSIRELCGSHDLAHLVKVLSAFYACRELP
ncbi:hypothetical protein ACQKP7_15355, partial [Pseudomonas frederiksbergensis]